MLDEFDRQQHNFWVAKAGENGIEQGEHELQKLYEEIELLEEKILNEGI